MFDIIRNKSRPDPYCFVPRHRLVHLNRQSAYALCVLVGVRSVSELNKIVPIEYRRSSGLTVREYLEDYFLAAA